MSAYGRFEPEVEALAAHPRVAAIVICLRDAMRAAHRAKAFNYARTLSILITDIQVACMRRGQTR